MTDVAQHPLFVKQYGERRTGTNYVRNLLLLNFKTIIPLMHILGDKHSAPVPLDSLWSAAASSLHPSWDFVYSATFSAPALTTDTNDNLLLDELARLAQPITRAFVNRELRYVVCIKHPYAWIASLSRYLGWSDRTTLVPSKNISLIAAQCKQFNQSYHSWLLLLRRQPENALLVRYEDLVVSPQPFLAQIEQRFGARRCSEEPLLPNGHVVPAHWDYSFPSSTGQAFDPQHYLEKRYLHLISKDVAEVIDGAIDWPLMLEFGYEPVSI